MPKSAEQITQKIEPFLRWAIDSDSMIVKSVKAKYLLTWNRFDLAFKLFYLCMRNVNPIYGEKIYEQHLRSFGLGEIREPGNPNKTSLEEFLGEFRIIYDSIEGSGFDQNVSIIPLSVDGSIVNGAHRLSSAIYLDVDISCIPTKSNPPIYNYNFFKERNIPADTLDLIACKFIEYSENIYLAFVWPSAFGNEAQIEKLIPNLVYKKSVIMSLNGAHNLLTQVYQGEKWLGKFEDNFPGARSKMNECFKLNKPLTVLAFQARCIEDVLEIKEKVRSICNIGKHSIHITDNKIEAIRLSQIMFNENSIHFLNYAKPTYFYSNIQRLKLIKNELSKFGALGQSVVIDGGTVLALYALRESEDIDYLSINNLIKNSESPYPFNDHEDQLKHHEIAKEELIWNPAYYFYYENIKFVSLKQIYAMKTNRDEIKDRVDCNSIRALINANLPDLLIAKFSQQFLYLRIKTYYFAYRILKTFKLVGFIKKVLKR